MLDKKKIDKRLKNYIKEHLSKGYSKNAVKKVLVDYGYDENYVDRLFKKHYQIQFAKVSSALLSLLFIISIFVSNIIPIKKEQQITGYVVSSGNEGCCISICQQTSKQECYARFAAGAKCTDLEECNIGCCIDKEGYCLTNYLKGNCINNYGTYVNNDCNNLIFCRNITDKSYTSRLYNLKNKKGAGFSSSKSTADYYKSSFNIQYYLYDKTNVIAVKAEIKDEGQLVDTITLYDDGFHNDGAKNDNLYGNNWLSSKVKDFDGFKKLDIDIIIRYADGTQQLINKTQSIIILNKNKCLPIYTELDNPSVKHSIIFAADNYEILNDGYQKFEIDVQNFLNTLFSIDKFSSNKDKFNIYRLEQSLSYFNIPTLINIVSNSCPSYSSKKDLIIILDNNEQYCVLESARVVRVNPQVLFYKNITTQAINETFANFCNYILTPKKLADDIIAFATPPKIIVHTLDNITYNTSFVNLSFSISAINYPINNSVFLENILILNKISSEEYTDAIIVNLVNGSNAVLIKSVDKNRNKAFAQLLINTTIQ